jgi:hypothetical protein
VKEPSPKGVASAPVLVLVDLAPDESLGEHVLGAGFADQ